MIRITARGRGIRVTADTTEAGIRRLARKLGYSRSQIERMWISGITDVGDGIYMTTLALSPTKRERARGINASSVICELIIETDA